MAGTRKIKGALGLVSSVAAASHATGVLKTARADKDKLALANALASIVVAITGMLLAVRSLREDGK